MLRFGTALNPQLLQGTSTTRSTTALGVAHTFADYPPLVAKRLLTADAASMAGTWPYYGLTVRVDLLANGPLLGIWKPFTSQGAWHAAGVSRATPHVNAYAA